MSLYFDGADLRFFSLCEGDCGGLFLLGLDGDGLFSRAVALMPGGKGVGSGRHVLQGKRTVFASHLKIWVADHGDIHAHPGVHVARDADGHFFARKLVGDGRGSGRLGLIPGAVALGHGVDVMRGGI